MSANFITLFTDFITSSADFISLYDDFTGLSADFRSSADSTRLSAPISVRISIVVQGYNIVRVGKESMGLGGYDVIRVTDINGGFYGKKDVIIVEGDTLYWRGLRLIKYC